MSPVRRVGRVLVAGVAAVLLLGGCANGTVVGATHGGVTARTSTDAPPWPAPTDLTARAEAAGLSNVWGQKLAEHVHTHLTILDGGEPVTVPGNIGHSDRAKFAAQIHTHDTSGIIHVESPTQDTFTLGQFFDEWGVSIGPAHVGGLHGDLTVWIDGRRFFGNPRSIELTNLRQVVLEVTTIGEVPRRPAPFDWPPQYH
ncbi:hypothetical protein [Curtobacterium sp. 458]|uniref:hypothetical protein n=1 Tax=Curtobacterium sp. 458 TaxID=3050069 RepID=UPI0025B318A8|nr:hypothetical protein [Curtobacterium sp. 458]WJX99651.1 hypothetical protein QPJ90_15270 [Curtobacterium sp. 458]